MFVCLCLFHVASVLCLYRVNVSNRMSGNLNPTKNAMRGLTVFISDLRNGMPLSIDIFDS